jgi:SAM-dependent methyltransferase
MDVGGGNGSLLIGILRANPALKGVVFDRPEVAARARENVASAGLAARCDVVAGDFFASVPSGADLHLLKHVIHDWEDERALAILATCHRALRPGGRLVIAEGVYPARVDTSLECRGAAANDVNMLVSTGGRQRSEAEFGALYEAAGFTAPRVLPTGNPSVSLIEGVRR